MPNLWESRASFLGCRFTSEVCSLCVFRLMQVSFSSAALSVGRSVSLVIIISEWIVDSLDGLGWFDLV